MHSQVFAERTRLHREEKAAIAAKRRAEAAIAEEEKNASEARRETVSRRNRQLAKSLRERAATDTIQRAVRRFIGTIKVARLRRKRAAFVRYFTGDQTGYAMKRLIAFQRRAKLWLRYNALFLALYEEHRSYVHTTLTVGAFDALGASLQNQAADLHSPETARNRL